MPLWKIHPVASPDDPRWQGRPIWREVVVRAPSAAMARVLASRLEEDPEAPPVGNESLGFRSGFEDEKLYWVVRLDATEAAALGDGAGGPNAICRAVLQEDRRETSSPASVAEQEDMSDDSQENAERAGRTVAA